MEAETIYQKKTTYMNEVREKGADRGADGFDEPLAPPADRFDEPVVPPAAPEVEGDTPKQ
jgi:hypothetical protein